MCYLHSISGVDYLNDIGVCVRNSQSSRKDGLEGQVFNAHWSDCSLSLLFSSLNSPALSVFLWLTGAPIQDAFQRILYWGAQTRTSTPDVSHQGWVEQKDAFTQCAGSTPWSAWDGLALLCCKGTLLTCVLAIPQLVSTGAWCNSSKGAPLSVRDAQPLLSAWQLHLQIIKSCFGNLLFLKLLGCFASRSFSESHQSSSAWSIKTKEVWDREMKTADGSRALKPKAAISREVRWMCEVW